MRIKLSKRYFDHEYEIWNKKKWTQCDKKKNINI